MTDEQLIDLFWTRSGLALEALQAKYGSYCSAILRQFLSDNRDVEECLNDVWLTVWNTIPPTHPKHFKGWLGTVTRNRAIAKGKQNGRYPETVDDSAMELASCFPSGDAQSETEAAELGLAISRFLRQQKESARTVFLRRYWYADSMEQAAIRMGWSVSKTKSVLFRVRKELKHHLQKEGFL